MTPGKRRLEGCAMVHLLSQLDPMVWLMMVVVAIAFVVSAVVLIELLPGDREELPPLPLNAGVPLGAPEPSAARPTLAQIAAQPAAARPAAARPAAAPEPELQNPNRRG
jgi:hypothetical protein